MEKKDEQTLKRPKVNNIHGRAMIKGAQMQFKDSVQLRDGLLA